MVVGAGVGAGVGALLAKLTQPEERANKGVEPPAPASGSRPPSGSSIVPEQITKAVSKFILMFRGVQGTAEHISLNSSIERLCHLRAEVMSPEWKPDILVQAEAYHLRRDCVHALSDVLSAHLPDNSSEFFVRNVVENKNGMIQLFTLVVNEIIKISRDRLLAAKQGA